MAWILSKKRHSKGVPLTASRRFQPGKRAQRKHVFFVVACVDFRRKSIGAKERWRALTVQNVVFIFSGPGIRIVTIGLAWIFITRWGNFLSCTTLPHLMQVLPEKAFFEKKTFEKITLLSLIQQWKIDVAERKCGL